MSKPPPGREPVNEGLPEELEPEERRVARMRLVAARRLAGLTVALDGVHDPHNISAVLRSCEGFGLQAIHWVEPRGGTNRAISMGCEKWLTLNRYKSALDCATTLHTAGFALWAAVPDRFAPTIEQVDFSRRIALVFGAERDGLSAELLGACDGRYQIRMVGFSQSLNVSVAAAISIQVAAGARRRLIGRDTDLTDAEVEALANQWIAKDLERKRHGRIS